MFAKEQLILFIGFVLYYILFKVSPNKEVVNPEIIREFKLKLHPYSGFDKDSYLKFVNLVVATILLPNNRCS